MPEDKKRPPTIAIEEAIYQKTKRKAEEKGVELKRFVNEILLMVVEKDEFLKQYAPSLSLDGLTEDALHIKDSLKNRTFEIIIRDSQLICTQDESNNCEHVHFALALPEIGKLKIKQPSTFPMAIKDEATGKMALVDYKQGHLYCSLDKSFDCDHVLIATEEEKKIQRRRKA